MGERALFKPLPIEESDPYHLDDVDHTLIRFLIRFPGSRASVLGKEVCLKPTAVRERVKKPAFQRALKEFSASALEQLRDVQAEAMRTIKTLLRSQNEHIRLAAAKTVLAGLLDNQASGPETTITYKVRFGDGGSMFREVMNGAEPDTIDLLKD